MFMFIAQKHSTSMLQLNCNIHMHAYVVLCVHAAHLCFLQKIPSRYFSRSRHRVKHCEQTYIQVFKLQAYKAEATTMYHDTQGNIIYTQHYTNGYKQCICTSYITSRSDKTGLKSRHPRACSTRGRGTVNHYITTKEVILWPV